MPLGKSFELLSCLHRSKAFDAVLDGNARRAASHVTYLRLDTIPSACGRSHGLFTLQISERLVHMKTISFSPVKGLFYAQQPDSGPFPCLKVKK